MIGNLQLPGLDSRAIFLDPWTVDAATWTPVAIMGFLVTGTCGLIGNYLILRRLALVGDAISHSVLPGLAIAYLLARNLHPGIMMLGAIAAGVTTTLLIELIQSRSRVKSDAAIGITFCTLFAFGVILINLFAGKIHLDADCVLHGELLHVPLEPPVVWFGIELGPQPVVVMGAVALVVTILIIVFYKELLLSSFDAALAGSLGFSPRLIHHLLMALLAVVVVSAFESVGAILVVAMLILPGATSQLLSTHLPRIHFLSVLHAALSTLLGIHLAIWLGSPVAAAIVIAGAFLFGLAWLFAPRQGLITRRLQKPIEIADEKAPIGAADQGILGDS